MNHWIIEHSRKSMPETKAMFVKEEMSKYYTAYFCFPFQFNALSAITLDIQWIKWLSNWT